MDCTTAQDQLSPLVDDALAPEQADAVLGHLKFCAGCARAHEALLDVSRKVRSLGAQALPAGFRERLERRRAASAAPKASTAAPNWYAGVPVAAAAALLLAFGLYRQRRPEPAALAEAELRAAEKRAPALEPPPPEAQPKRPAPAPAFSNAAQAEFLAEQRDDLGIRSVGTQRADEDAPTTSLIGGNGSITDPQNRPQVEATMRRMAALSRSLRERSQAPEVAIEGTTAVILKREDPDAGLIRPDAPPQSWSGAHSQNAEGTRTVYDAKEWAKLWKTLSPQPVPAVDFAAHQVVAVFLGPRPTGGFAPEILDVVLTPTAVIVQWQERAPAPGTIGPEGATSPYAMKVVPRTDLPVRYQQLRP